MEEHTHVPIVGIFADVHHHPSFHSPYDKSFVARLYHPAIPSLRKILEKAEVKFIDMLAISSCHPKPDDIDRRFEYYSHQLTTLEDEFDVDPHLSQGWVKLRRKYPIIEEYPFPYIVLIDDQQVRASYGNRYADLSVLCASKSIEPGQPVEDTAQAAIDAGGTVIACNVQGINGLSLRDAIDLFDRKKIHGLHAWDASRRVADNEYIRSILQHEGMSGIAVSNAHSYHHMGTAYTIFNTNVLSDFSPERLRETIQQGTRQREGFDIVAGSISSRDLWYGTRLPMLFSIPFELAKNPRYILKALKK